jgi:hypothetical protein
MKRFWIAKALKIALLVILGVAVFGYVVMQLWNWLLPPIAGWHTIDFAQAIGLLILARVLFGGFRGHAGGHWRHRMHERWAQMSPEERERFRAGLGRHCHHHAENGPHPATAGAPEPKQ